MWRFLIPLLLHSIDALPAARDVTSTCPHDALYTSLVSSGISFCSSVIGNGHCAGGGYTTPSAYLTYNQTQISSYVSCVVVQTHSNRTSTGSSTYQSDQSSYSTGNLSTNTSPGSQSSSLTLSVTASRSLNISGTLQPSTGIRNATSAPSGRVTAPGRIPPDGLASTFSGWNSSFTSSIGSVTGSGIDTESGPGTTTGRASENPSGSGGTIIPVPTTIPFSTLEGFTSTTLLADSTASASNNFSTTSGNSISTTAPTRPASPNGSNTELFNGTSSQVDGATSTRAPEFPAANFTQVTRSGAISKETCYSLARDSEEDPTRRALLHNAQLREENATIPIPYIQSVQFDSGGLDPLYLTVRDVAEGTYFIDISNKNHISVVDPEDNSMLLDANGIHFSTRNCTYGVSIGINNMLQQLATLAGVQCAASEQEKRSEDLQFRQVLNLHDQCSNPIVRTLRQYPQLRVGDSACTDTNVDETTGRWEFDCTFPGSLSGSMRCQWAIKNDVVDFLTTDPFGGSCPDLATVITTLEMTGQDFLNVESFRETLYSQRLNATQREEADTAAVAFEQLWEVLKQILSKSRTEPPGDSSALERYIELYNTYRNLENDICEDLHAGEIPLSLSLIAGVTRIDAITTLNWAPESPRSYNITIQNPSEIACCPSGAVAADSGDTCAYPAEATIVDTGCICGTTVGGESVAFEYRECENYVSECDSDSDCVDAGHAGFVCLTGSCCDGGVCVDPYACSQNGTELVKFGS
ncbi:hypothetical protein BGZ61DRAFT_550280 [Ilyonectria robusta]|uniref:uncharacterized protein n=1 Tax=Ilyonectria robusta TaxID=1079257 RepID=UPI001E8D7EBD|nr:uncharacterized protein BGZ61DRAFT_550280 [Ilyonectria robusta]KAH8683514.1 hypothetical protein BGZ61DRAFT_550280 [Ilyonectria robusta]